MSACTRVSSHSSILVWLVVSVSLASAPVSVADDTLGLDLTLSAGAIASSSSTGGLSLVGADIDALEAVTLSPSASLVPELAPVALGEESEKPLGKSYVQFRAGPIWFLGDADDVGFDLGVNTEIAFGYRIMPFLAIEVQPGFFWGDIDYTSVEVWGVPISANAKVTIPVAIFEVYAGAGIGGYWITVEEGPFDADDFVLGASGFVGINFTLGPALIGIEGKYIWTDDFDPYDIGNTFNFQGFAVMAQAGVSF